MWQHVFDNSRRHCWERTGAGYSLDSDFGKTCRQSHQTNPKVRGKVEWMRFIHAVGSLMPEDTNPFAHVLSVAGGVEIYRRTESLRSTEVRVIFRHTSTPPSVTIETEDETLWPIFDQALQLVAASY